MEFSVNHPILFVLVGIIIAAVIGQSVYFLVKALCINTRKGRSPFYSLGCLFYICNSISNVHDCHSCAA